MQKRDQHMLKEQNNKKRILKQQRENERERFRYRKEEQRLRNTSFVEHEETLSSNAAGLQRVVEE